MPRCRGYEHADPATRALAQAAAEASRAPSIFNSQPWRWRIVGDVAELRADRQRQLHMVDPDGRMSTISCGAVLHHARIALAAAGCTAEVARLPAEGDPDLLALRQKTPAERFRRRDGSDWALPGRLGDGRWRAHDRPAGGTTMRARDIMTSPVHTVRDDSSVEDAAAVLAAHDITAAPVLNTANEIVGMVSEGDLLRNRVPADPAVHPWRAGGDGLARPGSVGDVMTSWVVTARPSDDVSDVAQIMLERDVRSVPVVDDGNLVGIISRRDILRAMVRTDDMLRQEAQHRLDEYAGGVRRWPVEITDGTAVIDGSFDNDVERQVVAVLVRSVPGMAAARIAQPA